MHVKKLWTSCKAVKFLSDRVLASHKELDYMVLLCSLSMQKANPLL